MKHIDSYQNFLFESKLVGLASKGVFKVKEFANILQIKSNDKITSKYFDMIYQDYSKDKDLCKVRICLHDTYDTFSYKIYKKKKIQENLGHIQKLN